MAPNRTTSDASHTACVSAGYGVARRVDRTSADQRLAVFELMAVLGSDAVEHLHRLAHDLGADAVSRQKSNLQFHLLNDFK